MIEKLLNVLEVNAVEGEGKFQSVTSEKQEIFQQMLKANSFLRYIRYRRFDFQTLAHLAAKHSKSMLMSLLPPAAPDELLALDRVGNNCLMHCIRGWNSEYSLQYCVRLIEVEVNTGERASDEESTADDDDLEAALGLFMRSYSQAGPLSSLNAIKEGW